MIDTVEGVRQAIAFHVAAAGMELTEDTTFANLEVGSLDLHEIAMSLEEKFRIMITDYVVEKLVTVGDAIAFIGEARRATRPFFYPRNHSGIGNKVGHFD
jgi:acyl carrier protein